METKGTYKVDLENMDDSMKEIGVFMERLTVFVNDWKLAARLDDISIDEIQVCFVDVMNDICERLEILPADIGLE